MYIMHKNARGTICQSINQSIYLSMYGPVSIDAKAVSMLEFRYTCNFSLLYKFGL